jgi:zinc protease
MPRFASTFAPTACKSSRVSANAEELKKQIVGAGPSTIEYNTPKPADILAEDKIIGAFDIGLRPQDVTILPVDKVFE